MYVAYNGTKIIPAPHVSIDRTKNRTEDGSPIGETIRITLSGRFVHGKGGLYTGSGYPSDDFSKCSLEDLLEKQQEIRNLFAEDYKWFEIQPDPEATATVTKWIAKVISINFPSEPPETTQWTHYSDYTVVLEAQVDNDDSNYDSVNDYDETWELTYQDDPLDTYLLTHTITCSSKEQYLTASATLKDGWEKAYDYVNNILGGAGVDNTIVQGDPGFGLSVGFSAYDHFITQNVDEYSGIYSIRETWVMSESDTYVTQVISVDRQRDVEATAPDYTVTISGQVVGFRQDDDSGYNDAVDKFNNDVLPNLYSKANAAISGVTLKTTPVTSSVSYDEINRTVNYNYVYDNSQTYGTHQQTITVSTGEDDCNKITVVVSGTIQGIKDDSNSAYTNAATLWDSVKDNISSDADTAYMDFGGTGTLQGPSERSVTFDEFNGQINYSYSYHDWPTEYVDDQSINVEYDKIRDRYSISVNGNIVAFCTAGYSAATTYFNDNLSESQAYTLANNKYSGNGTLSQFAQTKTVTYNEHNRSINYNYVFNDYEDEADVDLTITVNTSSNDCGYTSVTLSGTVIGKKTNVRSAWQNANYIFTTNYADADSVSVVSDYIDNPKLLSASKNYNEFNNRISFSYEYIDEDTNYTIYENITTNYDSEDCGYVKYVQTGIVKGICTGGSASGLANAEIGYATVSAPEGANYQVRKSITKNERESTINYTIEWSSRSVPYEIEETITTRNSIDNKGDIITYSGTVIGYCSADDNPNVKYNNALIGYNANTPTTPDGYLEVSSSVGHNRRRGVITYNFEYKEKTTCITGVDAINESVIVNDDLANDIFAVVPILGGNSVIQDKNGSSPLRRSVNISIQVEPNTSCSLENKPDISTLLTNLTPSADIVVVEKDQESWEPYSGRYSRNKSWVYQDCTS